MCGALSLRGSLIIRDALRACDSLSEVDMLIVDGSLCRIGTFLSSGSLAFLDAFRTRDSLAIIGTFRECGSFQQAGAVLPLIHLPLLMLSGIVVHSGALVLSPEVVH